MKVSNPKQEGHSGNWKRFLFIVKSTVMYTASYLICGALAYQLLTKQFYVGPDPVFTAYLRSEANPAEWAHTNTWLVVGLLVRAVLISLVILPFLGALSGLSFKKRVLVVFAFMFVLMHLAAAAPSPSNVEGLIYMKESIVGAKAFLLTQPEMIAQCLMFAFGLSWIIKKWPSRAA